jgi:dTDP-4-dehydrorhamnose reductase
VKVLVFGAKGNLGTELVRVAKARRYSVRGVDREELDVTTTTELERQMHEGGYDLIINAVAYNNVDAAEDPHMYQSALLLNAIVPGTMARIAAEMGAKFVHYSSDYVFAGDKPSGYSEDDVPSPISKYGETKLMGEKAVLAAGGDGYIVRSSKLFGRPGTSEAAKPSFVAVMMKLAAEKPELSIVDEEVGCPTYTRDLAEATYDLVLAHNPGVYHLVNEGPGVTWYGFAEEFFGITGTTTPHKPIMSDAFPKPAKRPKFAPLINTRGPKLRPRIEALKEFLGKV